MWRDTFPELQNTMWTIEFANTSKYVHLCCEQYAVQQMYISWVKVKFYIPVHLLHSHVWKYPKSRPEHPVVWDFWLWLYWLFYETSQSTSRLQCFTTATTTWKIYISLDWKARHWATILKALWMQHVSAAPSERSWKHLEPGHGCNVQGDLLILLGCQTNQVDL